MPAPMQFRIDEPCHENWENMTQAEQGRFCAVCSKKVMDFTAMSDRELLQFFKKPADGSVCGRFYDDQLNRPVHAPAVKYSWFRQLLVLLAPALFVSKAEAQKTQKSQLPVTDTLTPRVQIVPENRILGKVAYNRIEPVCISPVIESALKGRITGESGEGVAFATVNANGYRQVMADSFGYFSMDLKGIKTDSGIRLKITAAGYEEKNITIQQKEIRSNSLSVELTPVKPLEEVVVESRVNIMGRLVTTGAVMYTKADTIFSKQQVNMTVNKPSDTGLLIYPNPSRAGQPVNISIAHMAEGYYMLQFFGLSGQLVKEQEMWIDGDARVINLQTPSVTAGNYFIYLVNRMTGKKWSAQISLL